MSTRRAATILVLCATVLTACAGSTPTVSLTSLGLPPGGRALAHVTINTSPDGGIYQNPDPMTVVMVRGAPGGPLISKAGVSAGGWTALERYGDFTFVGILIRNKGAAGSDPQLNAMQIAADYAPPGTATGPLSHFYHPMFPLALLVSSPVTRAARCTSIQARSKRRCWYTHPSRQHRASSGGCSISLRFVRRSVAGFPMPCRDGN